MNNEKFDRQTYRPTDGPWPLELLSQLKIIQHSNHSERGWGGGRQGLRLPLCHRQPQGGRPGEKKNNSKKKNNSNTRCGWSGAAMVTPSCTAILTNLSPSLGSSSHTSYKITFSRLPKIPTFVTMDLLSSKLVNIFLE